MRKISFFLLTAFIASSMFIFPTYAEETTGALTSDELTCIQNSLTTRDSALSTAYDTYTTAVKAALSARTELLKSAWAEGSTSEIKTALSSAWQTYKRSLLSARITLRRAKVAAWKQFRTDRTTCLTGNKTEIDTTDMQSDAQL
jgi:hypothetical protein